MGVYLGADSCYAKREGVYVRRVGHPGIDTIQEAVGILYLILLDLRRGWTYDPRNGCRKIRMTVGLFERRVNYVVPLAERHGASRREIDIIRGYCDYVLEHRRMPPGTLMLARRALARVK